MKEDKKTRLIGRMKTGTKIAVILSSLLLNWAVIRYAKGNDALNILSNGYSLFAFILLLTLLVQWFRQLWIWAGARIAWIRRIREHGDAHRKRATLIIYYGLRIMTIGVAVMQAINGEYFNVAVCILTLGLFTVPDLVAHTFAIRIPDLLETIIYLFIFAAEILGEINNFYNLIPFWDTMLHTLNGFLCAAVGFSLIDLLNRNSRHLNLSPLYLTMVAFCFSMTVGVLWEFFEFSMDQVMKTDMQKDTWIHEISSVDLNPDGLNKSVVISGIDHTVLVLQDGSEYVLEKGYLDIGLDDTMEDLFVNFVGALTFSLYGYHHIRKREQNRFVKGLIPTVESAEE